MMLRPRPRTRIAGIALLTSAALLWLASGAPGVGGGAFGAPPDPLVADTSTISQPAPQREPEREPEPEPADPVASEPSPFTTTAPRGAVDRATWPASVTIGRLAVEAAPVLAVGVGSARELVVPHSPMDVGWYQGGSVPGEPGVALLTSHVDTRTEGRGVFAGLVDLRTGDVITLRTRAGGEQRWTVTARSQHRKSDLPPELFARSGPAVLALVTCGGPFDREARSYRDNVIVWAEPA